jgi:hypothetical protein
MNKLLALALCLTFLSLLQSREQSEGWRGIVPLQSTRADVERLLGKSESNCGCSYKLADVNVFFTYSLTNGCQKGQVGGWNVPQDTVTWITVNPKHFISADDLLLDKIKYKVTTDDKFDRITRYIDESQGVSIEVADGLVRSFNYGPSMRDKHLYCSGGDVPARVKLPCPAVTSTFDPTGSYYFRDFEKIGFGGVHYFVLVAEMKSCNLSASGLIRTFDGNHYTFSDAVVTEDKLTFSTQTINNVRFVFDGNWYDNGIFAKDSKFTGAVPLMGKIRKYDGDKLVFEVQRQFTYYPEC